MGLSDSTIFRTTPRGFDDIWRGLRDVLSRAKTAHVLKPQQDYGIMISSVQGFLGFGSSGKRRPRSYGRGAGTCPAGWYPPAGPEHRESKGRILKEPNKWETLSFF